jgi:hypothetical protein
MANQFLSDSNFFAPHFMPDWRITIILSLYLMGTIESAKASRLYSIVNCRNYNHIVYGSCKQEEFQFLKYH